MNFVASKKRVLSMTAYADYVSTRWSNLWRDVLSDRSAVRVLLGGIILALGLEFLVLPSSPWNFNELFERHLNALSADGQMGSGVALTPDKKACFYNVPRNMGTGFSSLSSARVTVHTKASEPLKVQALLLTFPDQEPLNLGEFKLSPQPGQSGVQRGELTVTPSRNFIALYLVFDPAQLQDGALITEFSLNGWHWSAAFLRLPLLLLLALGAAILYSRYKRTGEVTVTEKIPALAVLFTAISLIGLLSWGSELLGGGLHSAALSLFFQNGDLLLNDFSIVPFTSAGLDPYTDALKETNHLPLLYVLGYFYCSLTDGFPSEYHLVIRQFPFLLAVLITLTCLMVCQALLIFHRLRGMSAALRALCTLVLLLSGLYLATLERGNVVMLSILCSMFFCFYYQSESRLVRVTALAALAVAINIKITPAALGILLLYRRQWRDILMLGALSLLILAGSFIPLNGGITDNVVAAAGKILAWSGSYMYASFSMGINGVLEGWFSASGAPWFKALTAVLMLGLSLLFLLAAPFFEEWERMLAVTACILVLSPSIFYYAVLILMPALVLYLSEERGRAGFKIKIWYLLPLGMIFASHLHLPAAVSAYQHALGILYLVLTVRSLQCLWPQVAKLFNARTKSPHSGATSAEHSASVTDE
ncbi:MAG: DUF2029 domain-containing protein [Succinivibrio sp.]|nr:DUF2029 domain-containing protein [Succinivibrio sp.]